jgi:hypothetical protein
MLIETDLNFGIASSHGFDTHRHDSEHAEIHATDAGADVPAPSTGTSGRPESFHVLEVSLPPAVKPLKPPSKRGIEPIDRVKPGGAVTFLMSSELYEDFPNPPYIGTTPNSFQFLRPAPKGATFYVGTASYEELIQASEVAIDAATRNGEVGQVAAILAIDCRGRHSIIGPEGLTDTAGLLTRRWGDRVCGIGADGETSATRWRIPLHRNWTFSTLVFGSDLSRRYLFAAERHSFAKLNLEVARGNKARVVYQTIVNIASRLLQVDDCYLWIYDPVRRKLIKEAGAGRWYEQLPTEIDAQLQPGLTSQHAFQEN